MKKKFIWLLIFTILFTTSIAGFQTVETYADGGLTLATFLAIVKYVGGSALLMGGAYELQRNWESIADSALVQELRNIKEYGTMGYVAISSALYSSIYNYVQGLGEGVHQGYMPQLVTQSDNGFKIGENTISVDDPTALTHLRYFNDESPYPYISAWGFDALTNSQNFNVIVRSGTSTALRNYFDHGSPSVSISWNGKHYVSDLTVRTYNGGYQTKTVNHPVASNDDFLGAGYLGLENYVNVSSTSIPLDSPWWDGKTVDEPDNPDEGKYLVPPIPTGWVNNPLHEPMPTPYLDNPIQDYNPSVDTPSDVWNGTTSIPIDPPIDNPIDNPVDNPPLNPPIDYPYNPEFPDIPATPDLTGITGLLSSIWAFFTGLLVQPDNLVQLNFEPLRTVGLLNKFPFSIPWDLYSSVQGLIGSTSAPVYSFEILGETVTWDFSKFNTLATIMRWSILMIFNVGLISVTREYII
ncbi:hypothetical protein SAMN05446037_100317 [Anaerovirgula multivorans]|uniref:Uncharacterized protein n=1 Tax=Anaerovirgula multivorans TaxID=312168 RepID=A0A239B7D5_9FIRM|nr:hypothetical protein [Anaerovirgula multivorans]SNS03094.1 hypothetical protein SAMN05446037_100317 [Anaerovirgula multivorans]